VDKARAKAKVETVRRSKARKAKQQTDAKWKTEVSQKLESLDKLSGLRKNVQRIMVALEKLAGIEGQDSNKELLSWLESEGEMTEVQGGKEDGEDEENKMGRQEEDNEMEDVEEGGGSFSPVAYSIGTGV